MGVDGSNWRGYVMVMTATLKAALYRIIDEATSANWRASAELLASAELGVRPGCASAAFAAYDEEYPDKHNHTRCLWAKMDRVIQEEQP